MGMEQIEHIVLVMMENRSFDHYLGALNDEGRKDIEGLRSGPLPINRRSDAGPGDPGVAPFPLDDLDIRFLDPPHEWHDVRPQWNGGKMDGFVSAYQAFYKDKGSADMIGQMAKIVMGYYTRKTLPVLYRLADQFVVCDHWHASFLGSTHPNRVMALAGATGDVITTTWKSAIRKKPDPVLKIWEKTKSNPKGITWKTYKLDTEWSQFSIWPSFANGHDRNAGTISGFITDCKKGELPQVAIVEPPYSAADDHPTHDPRRGQKFLGSIVDALLNSPSWKNSALILAYDEHGGFFDHVPPPAAPEKGEAPRDMLGVRVPALVVSPFCPAKKAAKSLYDHTSVLKTIAERWDLRLPIDVAPRLKTAKSLWKECFDFGSKAVSAAKVDVPPVTVTWRAAVDLDKDAPVQSDLVQSFALMSHIATLEKMDGMA